MPESKAFVPVKKVTTISMIGKSLLTVIPKEITNKIGLKKGDNLSASVDEAGRIVFEVLKK